MTGFPSNVKDRTFKIKFKMPNKRKSMFITSSKCYRNPVIVAKELKSRLDSGEFATMSEIACSLGYSRARITQILDLLNLTPKALEVLAKMGDHWLSPFVTERSLRPLTRLSKEKQVTEITKAAKLVR